MEAVLTAGLVMLAIAGTFLVAAGARRSVRSERGPVAASSRLRRAWTRLTGRQRTLLVAATAVGVGVYALSGWMIAIIVVPAGVLGIPWLLSQPSNRDIELLQALDRWVRGLSATIPTGKSITDAIRMSRRQAPVPLAPGLELVVARLDDRWTTREALKAFADQLANPDADAVLAALILSAHRGGTGASATLGALSDSIQDRLKALREIEAERAKPRIVVRQVTIITLVVLGVSVVAGGSFFAPYATPLGQVILVILIAIYVGSLVMLRTMTRPRARQRILQRVQT